MARMTIGGLEWGDLPEMDETPVRVEKVWSPEWRSWGVYVVNAEGHQIGDAEWGTKRDLPRMLASAEARITGGSR